MERFYIITNLMKDPDYGITKEIQKYNRTAMAESVFWQKKMSRGLFFPELCRRMWTAGSCWAVTEH